MGGTTMKRGSTVAVSLFICSISALCQTSADSSDRQIDEIFEAALEDGTRDLEDSGYAELLFQLSSNRIDVNEATADELLQVPGIDPLLAARIIAYRDSHRMERLRDLLRVEGMDRERFKEVEGFLNVERVPLKQSEFHFTSRTSRSLQDRQGYQDGTFKWTPYKLYNRLTARQMLDKTYFLEIAGLTEKDPGERNIADFLTGYLSLGTTNGFLRFVVGNYVIEAGQGLVFWRSSGPTKGSEVIAATAKNPRGLQPNISSDENSFFRGAAIQSKIGRYEVTAIYSQKSINANVNELGTITSLDAAGLFRTSGEISKKASSSERLIGLNSSALISDGFRVGLRGYTSLYQNPVELAGINAFHGKTASVAGMDLTFTASDVGTFGEVAVDRKRSVAFITGIVTEPISGITSSVVVRSYPKSFVSLHGYGFGESGNQIQNEQGVYGSLRMSLFSWLNVSAFYDQFFFPGPTAASLLPSNGNESMFVIDVKPEDNALLQLQIRRKARSNGQELLDEFLRTNSVSGRREQFNYRVTLEWWPSTSVRWKSRFERVRVAYSPSGAASNGFLMFQDVRFKTGKGISIDGRVVAYETDSYDSRIYEFESELRGTFANPALSGKGMRLYVLARYDAGSIEFSAKYASTIVPGVRSLSSGPNMIQGDIDNQVSAHVDITL